MLLSGVVGLLAAAPADAGAGGTASFLMQTVSSFSDERLHCRAV
jgi:hypothetical protein